MKVLSAAISYDMHRNKASIHPCMYDGCTLWTLLLLRKTMRSYQSVLHVFEIASHKHNTAHPGAAATALYIMFFTQQSYVPYHWDSNNDDYIIMMIM